MRAKITRPPGDEGLALGPDFPLHPGLPGQGDPFRKPGQELAPETGGVIPEIAVQIRLSVRLVGGPESMRRRKTETDPPEASGGEDLGDMVRSHVLLDRR